ncbi:MAG: ABC transporter ATP-binding protein [Candidatus Thermoplasmatota archaeon]|nr:ABC transporter ATP-binding protein [Candidatus Thermoplasmatota archaeon]
MEKIFECVDLCKTFQKGRKRIEAVKNASFSIGKGEIISLVGESGSGKSTLANLMLRFLKPTGGEAFLDGKKIEDYRKKEYWKKVQAIFQDPFSSFNDFFSVKKILERAIRLGSDPAPEEKRIREAVEAVNIRYEEICDKKPFELSGGQKQRLMIARIYLIKPEMLIADEPTSMIDAVLRAGILELLLKLRGTTIMLITHDLALAYYISDRMLIMQNGRIVEEGKPRKILEAPEHPYTKKLIEDVPRLSERWL